MVRGVASGRPPPPSPPTKTEFRRNRKNNRADFLVQWHYRPLPGLESSWMLFFFFQSNQKKSFISHFLSIFVSPVRVFKHRLPLKSPSFHEEIVQGAYSQNLLTIILSYLFFIKLLFYKIEITKHYYQHFLRKTKKKFLCNSHLNVLRTFVRTYLRKF